MQPFVFRIVPILLALTVLITACNREPQQPQVQQQPSPSEPRLERLRIVDAATPPEEGRQSTAFGPESALSVLLEISGSEIASVGVALFYMNSGQEAGRQTRGLRASDKQPHEFVFKPASSWQAGRYLIEVKLDGKVAAHQEIEIGAKPAL